MLFLLSNGTGSVPFPQREHVYWRRRLQAPLIRHTGPELRRLILHRCDHVRHTQIIEFEKCTKRRRSEDGVEEMGWENVSISDIVCLILFHFSYHE